MRTKPTFLRGVWLLTCLVAALPATTWALDNPLRTNDFSAGDAEFPPDKPRNNVTDFGSSFGSYASRHSSISATGEPTASMTLDASGGPTFQSNASGSMYFTYTVAGPAADVLVPLLFTFVMQASASAQASASVQFVVSTDVRVPFTPASFYETNAAFRTVSAGARVFDPVTGQQILSASKTFTDGVSQYSGHVGQVNMFGGASAPGGPCCISETAHAFIDPLVVIEAGFLASHPGYTVSLMAGIGNGVDPGAAAPPISAVPEPETYALLLAGLGAVGFAARRRERNRATF